MACAATTQLAYESIVELHLLTGKTNLPELSFFAFVVVVAKRLYTSQIRALRQGHWKYSFSCCCCCCCYNEIGRSFGYRRAITSNLCYEKWLPPPLVFVLFLFCEIAIIFCCWCCCWHAYTPTEHLHNYWTCISAAINY